MADDKKTEAERMKEGLAAQDSTQDQGGTRYAEPRGEDRFQPVDDTPAEFKPNAETDRIKTTQKTKTKLFPVKLLRNYRPISEDAQIQGDDGKYRPLDAEESVKVSAGSHVALPVAEATSVIEKKIAERNDPIA